MLLRAPIRRPRAGGPGAAPSTTAVPTTVTPTTVPPTTAPPLKAPTWDEIKNASIPALCTHEPTTLVDGKDVTLDGPDPTGQRVYRGMYELDPTELVSGLPSDAGPLTLVGVQCNAGGVGWPGELAAFSAGGVFYDQINPSGHGPGTWDDYQNSASNSGYYEFRDLWTAAGFDGPSRVTVTGLTLEGDHVRFTMGAKRPGECEACATGTATVTVSVQGGRLHVDSVTAD